MVIRILIVEDHQVVAEALEALLNQQPDMMVVGNIDSVEDASHVADLSPDVLIVDFHLNDGTGADAVLTMRQLGCEARVIFLTRDDSDTAHFAAIQAGASAFLHKSTATAGLVDAVRRVAEGENLVAPATIANLLNRRREIDGQRDRLTTREKEIVRLMAGGTSNREIGTRLGISYTTVRGHIGNLGSKLACHSKLEVIVRARELALVD
jgi:DNA-binding NarL/FixJ family response regulator